MIPYNEFIKHKLSNPVERPSSFKKGVTIVIPCFNHGHYMRTTLESISKQDFDGDIQTIVFNDNSTDNTLDTLQGLQKEFDFELVNNEENRRQWWILNEGVNQSKYDISMLFNADDYLIADATRRLYEAIINNENCNLVGAYSLAFSNESQIPGLIENAKKNSGDLTIKDTAFFENGVKNWIEKKEGDHLGAPHFFHISTGTMMFINSMYKSVGGCFPIPDRYTVYEDKDLQGRYGINYGGAILDIVSQLWRSVGSTWKP